MIQLSVVCTFFFTAFGYVVTVVWNTSCPQFCHCFVTGTDILQLAAKTVSCENVSLSSIPENISFEVEVLNIRQNAIGRAEDLNLVELLYLRKLLLLDLSWNRIRGFRNTGGNLESIRYLNLSYNGILTLETGMFRGFINLEVLNLRANRISAISPMAFELPKLRELDLSENKLSTINSHFFSELSELRTLVLCKNNIGRLTEVILQHMNDVDLIDLDHNKISRVDSEVLRYVKSIRELRLSDNHFYELPHQALEVVPYIGKLTFCRNPVRALRSGSFRDVQVSHVYICSNRELFAIESQVFVDMPVLKSVVINNNPRLQIIKSLSFVNVPALHLLDLLNNSLYSFSESTISKSEASTELFLGGNPLYCDCNVRWLQNVSSNLTNVLRTDDILCDFESHYLPLAMLDPLPYNCSPTILPLFPEQMLRLPSNDLIVYCIASGNPPPLISWLAPNQSVISTQTCHTRMCVVNNVLHIRYLHHEDSGRYVCVANNALGNDSHAMSLSVKDLNIRIIPVTVTSTYVTLSWNISSGIANDYVLQYKASRGEFLCNKTIFMGIKGHSYTLSGLQPGETYIIWLGIQKEEYIIRLSSVEVTTKGHGFLIMLGIHTNYLSIILVATCGGIVLCTCLCLCCIRLYRLHNRKHNEMVLSDTGSQRCFAKSESATSDLAFMTYVNVADEAVLVANDDESYE